jgi:hypothetical protein
MSSVWPSKKLPVTAAFAVALSPSTSMSRTSTDSATVSAASCWQLCRASSALSSGSPLVCWTKLTVA